MTVYEGLFSSNNLFLFVLNGDVTLRGFCKFIKILCRKIQAEVRGLVEISDGKLTIALHLC